MWPNYFEIVYGQQITLDDSHIFTRNVPKTLVAFPLSLAMLTLAKEPSQPWKVGRTDGILYNEWDHTAQGCGLIWSQSRDPGTYDF